MSEEVDESYKRNVPPSMPSGFKAFQMDHIFIIDFLTAFPNEVAQVFNSVALTKDVAENLVRALTSFIEDENDESDESNESTEASEA